MIRYLPLNECRSLPVYSVGPTGEDYLSLKDQIAYVFLENLTMDVLDRALYNEYCIIALKAIFGQTIWDGSPYI